MKSVIADDDGFVGCSGSRPPCSSDGEGAGAEGSAEAAAVAGSRRWWTSSRLESGPGTGSRCLAGLPRGRTLCGFHADLGSRATA